jgi:dihydroxyacid dehydratase/phosphogluconate dehydratase
MLHLRKLGLLQTEAQTVSGKTLGENLDWWEKSERRSRFRELLQDLDKVAPDSVILPPALAQEQGLSNTLVFPRGNLAPEGSVVKSAAIDPAVLDADGVFRKTGPSRVFVNEKDAISAIKENRIKPNDIMVLAGVGPMGTGMEETYQVTGALKHIPYGKDVALLTDARFSGVSTGACIGHIGPEALAGGPIGKVLEGDIIQILIDPRKIQGTVDLVGDSHHRFTPEEGTQMLARRSPRSELAPNPDLPEDTRLWAALQLASGGTWKGCVYDPDRIIAALNKLPPTK